MLYTCKLNGFFIRSERVRNKQRFLPFSLEQKFLENLNTKYLLKGFTVSNSAKR